MSFFEGVCFTFRLEASADTAQSFWVRYRRKAFDDNFCLTIL